MVRRNQGAVVLSARGKRWAVLAIYVGTQYQARVIAYIYVRMLAQMPLRWIGESDDTPYAVAGETGGPGDDIKVEFGGRRACRPKIQAKHGLRAGARLLDAIDSLVVSSDSSRVLVVDSSSTARISGDLGPDLERLRSGRGDPLSALTQDVLDHLGDDGIQKLASLFIRRINLEDSSESHLSNALDLLASRLEDGTQAQTAWNILLTDANLLCASQLRRTRLDLVRLLESHNIRVRPLQRDELLSQRLDTTRDLLNRHYPAAALSELAKTERAFADGPVDVTVRYRLAVQRSSAYMRLGRHADAEVWARRALELDATGFQALRNLAVAQQLAGKLADARSTIETAVLHHTRRNRSFEVVRAQVQTALGETLLVAPEPVASHERYRVNLRVPCHRRGQRFDEVLTITAAQGC